LNYSGAHLQIPNIFLNWKVLLVYINVLSIHPPLFNLPTYRILQTLHQIFLLNTCNHGISSLSYFCSSVLIPLQVKEGDSIPNIDLYEDSPGNKVNLSKELASGKGVVIGVPAAFSPSCSDTHVPGYIASDKLKDAGKVFVVSVNDAFV
jgi:hypothetical protein